MHAPTTAWTLLERWAALEGERAAVAAEIARRRALVPVAAVQWGRHTVTDADALKAAPPPGWALLDVQAMERHRRKVEALANELEAAQRHANEALRTLGVPDLEAQARQLGEEAAWIAAAIRRAPITSSADVLARLDILTVQWNASGEIADPGRLLAELLVLMEAIARRRPQFVPTWTRRRAVEQG